MYITTTLNRHKKFTSLVRRNVVTPQTRRLIALFLRKDAVDRGHSSPYLHTCCSANRVGWSCKRQRTRTVVEQGDGSWRAKGTKISHFLRKTERNAENECGTNWKPTEHNVVLEEERGAFYSAMFVWFVLLVIMMSMPARPVRVNRGQHRYLHSNCSENQGVAAVQSRSQGVRCCSLRLV
ncbi:hypothetical protein ZHAS_00010466 [Anopheles sinensis]|uniref:Uncharacterized protein n=1 Tax=Anopheles sinensis TaxID=74873 RepID=A0A084VXN1_ANOSI|nr:hypothetical protein ZHAS_00010466 [Anopheles sinensis]